MLLEILRREQAALFAPSAQVSQLELPAAAASAGHARQALRDACRLWEVSSDLFELGRLAISELVTNALTHADTPMIVSIEYDHAQLLVAVSDGDPTLPQPQPEDLGRETGRGMAIIDQLGLTWGVQRTVLGKTVWVLLDDPGTVA